MHIVWCGRVVRLVDRSAVPGVGGSVLVGLLNSNGLVDGACRRVGTSGRDNFIASEEVCSSVAMVGGDGGAEKSANGHEDRKQGVG